MHTEIREGDVITLRHLRCMLDLNVSREVDFMRRFPVACVAYSFLA